MPTLNVPCRYNRAYRLDTSRTALVLIDIQRDFFLSGEDEPVGELWKIVPRCEALLALARELGLTVIHTREGYAPDLSDVSSFRAHLGYVGREGGLGRFLIRGEPGHGFLDALRPAENEVVIDKAAFSAFYQTHLDKLLRAKGIDHLLLAGVTTQACVHSTLRDAVDRGYWCLTVADCCAAEDPDLHEAALALIAGEGHLFGWIADFADVRAAAQGANTLSAST